MPWKVALLGTRDPPIKGGLEVHRPALNRTKPLRAKPLLGAAFLLPDVIDKIYRRCYTSLVTHISFFEEISLRPWRLSLKFETTYTLPMV